MCELGEILNIPLMLESIKTFQVLKMGECILYVGKCELGRGGKPRGLNYSAKFIC